MPFQLNPKEISKAARDKRISFADQDEHSVNAKALSNT